MLCHVSEKSSKMDQYLSDLFELRSQPKFKFNVFEHIPKNMTNSFESNEKKSGESYLRKQNHICLNSENNNWNNFIQENIIKKPFDCRFFSFMFYDFSFQENLMEILFTKLRIVGLESNNYI